MASSKGTDKFIQASAGRWFHEIDPDPPPVDKRGVSLDQAKMAARKQADATGAPVRVFAVIWPRTEEQLEAQREARRRLDRK